MVEIVFECVIFGQTPQIASLDIMQIVDVRSSDRDHFSIFFIFLNKKLSQNSKIKIFPSKISKNDQNPNISVLSAASFPSSQKRTF
jgi:hypothetical protein